MFCWLSRPFVFLCFVPFHSFRLLFISSFPFCSPHSSLFSFVFLCLFLLNLSFFDYTAPKATFFFSNSYSDSQVNIHVYWNQSRPIHCRVHKSTSLYLILNHVNSVVIPFSHPFRRLKKIRPAFFRENWQWLKFPLNGLRAQSRISPVVGLLPLASGPSCLEQQDTLGQIAKELKITPILDKLLEYKSKCIQHVNRIPRNRLPRVMKHYSPTGRRNHGRPVKRLLDTWDRKGSTSGPQLHDRYRMMMMMMMMMMNSVHIFTSYNLRYILTSSTPDLSNIFPSRFL